MISKDKIRQIVLWVMAADFPLLYMGAVSLENSVMTIITLAVLGLAVAVAAAVY